ncbi:M28 family peptidase [Alteromonas ponticola]|uniref:M28 family peptidase n=1 Tax=Alteromonas aquimaris TaxID=2998417 RepID=A0ABT3P3U3_9ALTE|nr:M28 family peptidase [Alteromonas aquimaris]MCW8107444.1 M28 family peptidase [Alteromonas aquimaris]
MSPQLLNQAVENLKVLSADDMTGRKPGTPGHEKAADFISHTFASFKLTPLTKDYIHQFSYEYGWSESTGSNVVGMVKGKRYPDKYIVVTAHYDHLGTKGRHIYNGADDNASGVAALIALAAHFSTYTPDHSIIFMATDVEEAGLKGVKAFLTSTLINTAHIILNVNVDMIGNGGKRHELYVLTPANASFEQFVRQYIETHSSSAFRLKVGQPRKINRRSLLESRIDWRRASDHAAFASAGIPYIYFGNDVHSHYHEPSDTFENINKTFFSTSLSHITQLTTQFDRHVLSGE